MLHRQEILEYLRFLKEALQDEYGIEALGLFGSYALDIQGPDSDIDILIEFEPNTQDLFEKKEKLRDTISQRFNKEVDICRKKYIKSFYKKHILDSVIYA